MGCLPYHKDVIALCLRPLALAYHITSDPFGIDAKFARPASPAPEPTELSEPRAGVPRPYTAAALAIGAG
jgi:hypothetical protein